MKTRDEWRKDEEYVALVADLLAQPAVQKLANYTQHHHSDRLQHSLSVSYDSYRIAKRLHLDYVSTARAGLLGTHAFIHPRVALRNAEKLTPLNPKEKDIILKHMFGATLAVPRYAESLIVSLVDDYEAQAEFFGPLKRRWQARMQSRRLVKN